MILTTPVNKVDVEENWFTKKLEIGFKRVQSTVMFIDIHDFTYLCDVYKETIILSQLCEYFDCMTQVVTKWGGVVDKLVGDQIMAVWERGYKGFNHAELAVQCVLEQRLVLNSLHRKWAKQSKPLFNIGVGINSGFVYKGSLGGERGQTTVMGDVVNVASKIEKVTRQLCDKNAQCSILMTAATHKLTDSICETTFVDLVALKGKKGVKSVYLLNDKETDIHVLNSRA